MPGAGGRADERERRQREPDRRRRRSLADDDVELEVLHRRVEDLLDGPRQAVDLVDEQHVAVVELGEDGGQVAGPLERRARRDVQVHAHLGGDDAGEGGLAEPGRAGEQQVVGRLADAAAPPRARSRGAPSARAGRRTRRAAGAAARLSSTSSSSPVTSSGRGTRHARRAPSSLQRVAQQVGGVAVGGKLAQRVADLLRRVAEAAERLAHVGDRRRAVRPPRRWAPTASSTGRSSRFFSSTSSRSAVFLPTPGTSVSAPRSALATMSTQRGRRVRGQDRHRQRRADAVRRDQHLERAPLVAARGSRTASARPRGCGGARGGTRSSSARARPACAA